MKTVKEIAKEKGVMFEGGKYSVVSIDEMEEIAKAFASQAIDECLKSKVDLRDNFDETVNVKDILKVKELLK